MSRPWLPHLLRELADDLGDEAASRCARQYGGQRLYIPKQATADHPIAQAIGYDAMDWLVRRYGGTDVKVPQGASTIMGKARDEARTLIAAGISIREAARRTGLHLRTLERMLRRLERHLDDDPNSHAHYRRDSRQRSLFED